MYRDTIKKHGKKKRKGLLQALERMKKKKKKKRKKRK